MGVKDVFEVDVFECFFMACSALFLCGFVIIEVERGLLEINVCLCMIMIKVGLVMLDDLVICMIGCFNGCVCLYMVEFGFVGDGSASY